MPDDDLEYYITFPSPIPSCKAPGSSDILSRSAVEDDYVLVGSQGKEPVVFLLGWLGAQDKHLSKYSQIYNHFGCITIRYTAPVQNLLSWSEVNLKNIAKRLVNLIEEMTLEEHPILFHCFSNHGSRLYYYISTIIEQQQTPKIKLSGCIFDSAPAPRKIISTVTAVYRATTGPLWMRLATAAGVFLYLMCWTVMSLGSTLLTGKLALHPPWALIQEKARVPQLLLYSEADDIISFEDIEAFASARADLGVPVVTQKWQDSAHVQHLREHPEEYKETVYSFLAMCLSDSTEHIQSFEPTASTSRPKED